MKEGKTMKKIITGTLCGILILFLMVGTVFAGSRQSYSWYCVRNKDHLQPRLDAKMRFVEACGGYHVDKKHGDDCPEKIVYLTFDAGYENGNVAKILDVLKAEKVPGAFFVLGNLITTNKDLILRMIDEGHTVCNHTYSHRDMTNCSNEEFALELKKLEDAYSEVTGATMPKYYRPPEGKFSRENIEFANTLGYKTVFWSFAYADWDNDRQMNAEEAKKKILSNIHNGAIILLHPTSSTNAEILDDVIRELKSQGYEFGTLDQLTA